MDSILEQLNLTGIIPVTVIEDELNADPLAQALSEGGLSTIEITFRTEAAKEAMLQISKKYPSIILGAGTIIKVDQIKTAIDCGAKYIVSPGLNRKVVEYCLNNEILTIPGITTPSEIESAMEMGVEVLKFFPAEAVGGVRYLKAISGPYKNVKFVPTGGLDESNFLQYLKLPQVFACGGSWMVKTDYIRAKRFDEIKKLTSTAIANMLGFQMLYPGIDTMNEKEVSRYVSLVSQELNFPIKKMESSINAGSQFEFLTNSCLNEKNHIVVGTNFIDRAIYYCGKKGIDIKYKAVPKINNGIPTVYLNKEINGSAVHLLQL